MKRAGGVLAMVGAVALAALYGSRARTGPGAPSVTGAAPAPPVVETCRLRESAASNRSAARTLTLSGVIESDDDVAISPKVPGRILSIRVRSGERVRAGQVLATLDIGDYAAQVDGARAGVAAARAVVLKAEVGKRARAAELDAAVAEARGCLGVAQAKLKQAELGVPLTASTAASDAEKADAGVKQAEAGVAQADAGLRQAQDVVRRLEVLHKHGGVADADLEGARTQAAIARAGYDTALAGLDLARAGARAAKGETPARRRDVSLADADAARAGVKAASDALDAALRGRAEALRVAQHDTAAASAQLAQARAGLAQAMASIGNGVLSSPASGVVTTVSAHAGEHAQPGLAVMRVVALGSLHVEVAAPGSLLSSIREGRSARVMVVTGGSAGATTDAAALTLPARVSEVAPFMEPGGRSARVRLRFTSPSGALRSARLRPGAVVRVEIQRDRASVQSVPYTAVRFEGSQAFVMVLAEGVASRRTVILGRTFRDRVEIVDGLTTADRVLVSPPHSLRDGDAVREAGQ